jgi:hypothetical protein
MTTAISKIQCVYERAPLTLVQHHKIAKDLELKHIPDRGERLDPLYGTGFWIVDKECRGDCS